jgi:hypothetical protein
MIFQTATSSTPNFSADPSLYAGGTGTTTFNSPSSIVPPIYANHLNGLLARPATNSAALGGTVNGATSPFAGTSFTPIMDIKLASPKSPATPALAPPTYSPQLDGTLRQTFAAPPQKDPSGASLVFKKSSLMPSSTGKSFNDKPNFSVDLKYPIKLTPSTTLNLGLTSSNARGGPTLGADFKLGGGIEASIGAQATFPFLSQETQGPLKSRQGTNASVNASITFPFMQNKGSIKLTAAEEFSKTDFPGKFQGSATRLGGDIKFAFNKDTSINFGGGIVIDNRGRQANEGFFSVLFNKKF